jgi:hypothetical protein
MPREHVLVLNVVTHLTELALNHHGLDIVIGDIPSEAMLSSGTPTIQQRNWRGAHLNAQMRRNEKFESFARRWS